MNPKVNQVLEEHGYDPEPIVQTIKERIDPVKLDQFEQKQFLLSEETDNVENSVELETRESVSIPVKQEPTEDSSILLSDFCDRFIKSREERGITPRTLIDCQDSTNLLLEVVGDIPVHSLSHSDGRELVQTLKKLSKNRKSRYPNKTINELVEMENVELINDNIMGKLFSKIITLFNWSINQGYVKEISSKGN